MEKRYKEIDGVRYQVIQNTILGSNVVPVGESLPEVTVSDSGKVLGVNSSGEWVPVDAPSDLPEVTSADAGDVLTVNASGEWEAAAPSGGGGLTLYGPYKAYNSQSYPISVSPDNLTTVYLDYVEDAEGNECDTNLAAQSAGFFIPVFLQLSNDGKVHLGGLNYPYLDPYNGSYAYTAGLLSVVNDAEYTIGDYQIILGFLSTIELPLAQSEGE